MWTCSASSRTRRIRIRLPIHFKGEASPPGVKTEGGVVSHLLSDVEIICLPKDLPEFLEIDLSDMHLNDTKFLADVPVPAGRDVPELAHGNAPVVSIHAPRAEEPEAVAAEAAAVPVEGAAPAAGAAAAAAGAAGAPAAAATRRRTRTRRKLLPPRRKAARSNRTGSRPTARRAAAAGLASRAAAVGFVAGTQCYGR